MLDTVIIAIAITAFIILIALGMNIATCLFATGLLGLILWEGSGIYTLFSGLVGSDMFYAISKYSLSIIPLYVLMALILVRGNIIEDLFVVIYKLSGKRRFFLGSGTIVLGGFLGAVTGSGAAISAALATTASPQLHKYKYSRPFAISIGAVGGSLAAIIPPSIIIMIYGSLAEISIGKLFIGSIIPGILCILVYIVCLFFYERFSKTAVLTNSDLNKNQVDEQVEIKIGKSIPAFIFVLVLMVIIFGGIYGGFTTAGEAGAVGAFASILGMMIMRRISMRDIREALADSLKITGMIMIIVMGAQIFGRFLSYAMIPRMLVTMVEPIIGNTSLVIAILLFMLFIFGMFIESAAIMVMTVPVMLPILLVSDIDLIWYGVMACFVISLGLLTPPLGLSVYTAAGAGGYPVEKIFSYTLIFAVVAAVILIPLLIYFPQLILYLPSRM